MVGNGGKEKRGVWGRTQALRLSRSAMISAAERVGTRIEVEVDMM